jgi:Fe2+ or Zn2+ uptake regulation protein
MHHERWGKGEDELDELDNAILKCITKHPGLNITRVWNCVNNGTEIKLLSAYYRINTLQRAGYIETKKGYRNERLCYLTQATEEAWRGGVYGAH